MKKATISFTPNKEIKQWMDKLSQFDKVESYELIEILRLDIEKGLKIILVKMTLKEPYTLKDINFTEGSEILSILKQENNQYICLIKGQAPLPLLQSLNVPNQFNLNLKWDTPTYVNQNTITSTVIGEESEIQIFLDFLKQIATIDKISLTEPIFHKNDLLNILTEKQRSILITAKQKGYYDYPRKINSEKLAQTAGISKATIIEHLRKAESRILHNILQGY